MVQIDTDQREQVAKELRDAEFQINDVSPKLTAATDQMGRIQLKAPATGTVVALTVFGVGGVIAPGQRLLDVVPDHAPLVIEARFNPSDVDGVHVGKIAEVKLGGEKDRAMPILKGVISRLSADSLVNEKTGQPYFSAEVTVPPDQMALAYKARGAEAAMRPGLPAQVIVPLAKRTALDYLVEPLTRTLWRGFRER
jgi:HlyD family secretion protein